MRNDFFCTKIVHPSSVRLKCAKLDRGDLFSLSNLNARMAQRLEIGHVNEQSFQKKTRNRKDPFLLNNLFSKAKRVRNKR